MADTRARRQIWLVIALAVSCALPLIFSSDSPWIFDEPKLLQAAEIANHTPDKYFGFLPLPFTISSYGLPGNRGAIYGPAAEWFYQIMLAVLPHNLVLLSGIRAAIVTIATAGGLFWLSRVTGLSLRFAVAIMLSPWLWFYARQLWDNSFCIPLSVLTLAAYAQFIKTNSRGAFILTIAGLFLLPLLHLMAVALVMPIVLHLFIFQTRRLIRFRWELLAVVVVMGTISLPYIAIFKANYHPNMPGGLSPWQGWFFPLLGGHHLSAIGLADPLGSDLFFGGPFPLPYILNVAIWLSGMAYIAVWIGMILALPRGLRVIKRKPDCTALDHIAALSIGVWLFQTILDGAQRVYDLPHYYDATWIAYAVFAWLAVDAMPRARLWGLPLPTYAACNLIVIAFLLVQIHIDGGNRSRAYGTAIANQQQIADEIGNDSAAFDFGQWQEFPVGYQAIKTLRHLSGRRATGRHFVVQYRNAFPGDARIVLREDSSPATQSTASDH